MPIYEYQCRKCRRTTEILQGISDPPAVKCPECGGRLDKMMSPGAFIFKGSGFYATDYARKGNGNGSGGRAKAPRSGATCPAAEASSGEASPACAGCPKAD